MPARLDHASISRKGSPWRRLAGDIRLALVAMAVLAVIMNVAFPIWRLAASREGYVAHLSDDSFYYFSVSPNLAAGRGPTADGVTVTTGWHPLYGFILAGLYRLTNPSLDGFPREAIALNAIFYLFSAYYLYRAAKTWWGRNAGIAAALLWLTNPYGVLITAQGLESSLYAMCLSLLLWRLANLVTQLRPGNGYLRGCLLLGFCAALAVLARTDSVMLMPFVAIIVLIAGSAVGGSAKHPLSWPMRLMGMAILTLPVVAAYGAWLAYVHHYTGEFHQGSAAVKMEWRKFLLHGMSGWAALGFTLTMTGEYLSGIILKVPALKWLLTGIPLLSRMTKDPARAQRGMLHFLWIMPVVLGVAYGCLLDWVRAWYYLPGLLTLTLLTAGAGAALLQTPSDPGLQTTRGGWTSRLQRLVKGTLGLIAWAIVLESGIVFGAQVHAEFDSESEKFQALHVANWLEKNAEPRLRIGCWHSGIIGYYTPTIDVINLDGLNNNGILPILRGDRLLNPYWDEIGLAAVAPPVRSNPKDAEVEVSGKMGRFRWAWDHKRLVPWRDAPGVPQPSSLSLDIYDQFIRQKIYRIIENRQIEPATRPGR